MAVKLKQREPRLVNPTTSQVKVNKNTISACLCIGRHDIIRTDGIAVITDSIFENTLPVTDFEYMQNKADKFFIDLIDNLYTNRQDPSEFELHIYVSGLAAALASALLAYETHARKTGLKLVLMHYDKEIGNYNPQVFEV